MAGHAHSGGRPRAWATVLGLAATGAAVALVPSWLAEPGLPLLLALVLLAGVVALITGAAGLPMRTAVPLAALAMCPLAAVAAPAEPVAWLVLPLLVVPLVAVHRTAHLLARAGGSADRDPLTGLPQRQVLVQGIESALAEPGRAGVVVVDLDRFRTINETLGYTAGDSVLTAVARRLAGCLRPGDTLARMGGAEFAIVRAALPEAGMADLVRAIRTALAQPIAVGSHRVTVTCSLGIATQQPGATAETLLGAADSAMHRAKQAGRDQVALAPADLRALDSGLPDHRELSRAIEDGELRAHYQPVIDLVTGRPIGMEALIRWQHPQRGLLHPDAFIPPAEQTGQIRAVGAWMLDESLRQLGCWRAQHPGARQLWMAVNLSPRQLCDPELLSRVRRSLRDQGLPGSALHLEITETAVMHSAECSAAVLDALRGLGVQIIVDDFGTGYSSLERLTRLPVTALKIDRSFVEGLELAGPAGSTSISIVDAITNLARSMQLEAIAEGVETEGQREILNALGATMGQGHLWSRALPADEVAGWLHAAPRPSAGIGTLTTG